ncbi:tetratricopeptide repeat protein [Marinithermus hydrothermalis]|uniref:Tetratricopeptide TPR_2 repeat-containing protein n=1 Tax=Marinithermus hydrothermalis (strain DSM 14884 / JCM 11576 / T1) TaxID=869210 RepID=F2NKU0_MARHT|nr:tetratricopeptide repeat protein [Marinithermus hydrothermalis]AEB10853.1 Tetratricopeptide TPR_2 repeat-containing protein [Marinithermus hydrothermalis DSM 14884]
MRFLWGVLLLLGGAVAQLNPGPAGHYARCQALYQEGDLESAAATCELALTADERFVPALKLLARIHLDRGQPKEAEAYLERLTALTPTDPEVGVLVARHRLAVGRPAEALTLLADRREAEALWLKGQALAALGRYPEALEALQAAWEAGEVRARLDAARVYERLGRPTEALAVLPEAGPEVAVLRGRLLLAAGELDAAARVLEDTLPQLNPLGAAYLEALTALALAYYGQGEFYRGGTVLRQLGTRVNLAGLVWRKAWLWGVGVILLLALHLYAESRIEPVSAVEIGGAPSWGVGSVYAVFLMGWGVAAAVALLVGWGVYGNLLAVFTPVQREVVRPAFYLSLGAALLLFSAWRVRRSGLEARALLGHPAVWPVGLGVGVFLAAALVLYAWLARAVGGLEAFPVALVPWGALAFIGFALAEVAFRGFAFAAFRERYGPDLAPYFTVLAPALVLMSPLLLWVGVGAGLYWVRHRWDSVLPGAVGFALVGGAIALLGQAPWVRALF